jgi:pyruvate dehydrogenase E2 component (dihydrolipoamide acetyltransferase)
MFVFELPEIGEGVVEGEIVRWMVAEGDLIRVDQPVCEVMTDKATVEITTPRGGRVSKRHGVEGQVVKVHSPLLEIDDGAGSVAAAPKAAQSPRPAAPVAAPAPVPMAAPPAAHAPAPVAAPVPAPAPAPAPRAAGAKTLATPAVRSHARQAEVDIEVVPGSGPGGRVTRADIDAFAAQAEEAKAPPALPAPAPLPGGGDQRVKIIGLRRKIAEKMSESKRLVPHFCYVDEVDCTELVELRKRMAPAAEATGVKLTYLPFIMKSLVAVFREFPTVNAVMDESDFALIVRGQVNIGIATDTPAGLFVPVVHDVQSKTILELARDIAEVTELTRQGKVPLGRLQGGTFTITSVGNIGGRFATPIINHPEVAILGVNQIHDRPMVHKGAIVARKMMYLSPSFDHRIIDGAVAARFVAALKAILEQPEQLLLHLR